MRAPWPNGSIATMPSPTKSDGVVNPERTILLRSVSGSISGCAERCAENGTTRRFNTAILVAPNGDIAGKYRKTHVPGSEGDGLFFSASCQGARRWKTPER